MKKLTSMAILALATALIVSSQSGCTPSNNNSGPPISVATPDPTPDQAAIEAELIKIEKDWPRVLRERDLEAVRRVEADDIVEIIPDGSMTTKAQDLVDMQSGNMTVDSWEVAEAVVTVLNRDAAFVTGRSVIKGGKVKGPDGRSIDISGEYRFMDTFARRDGQWKMVASVVVKIQNPLATATPSPAASPSPTPKASPAAKGSPAAKASPAKRPSPILVKPSPEKQ